MAMGKRDNDLERNF